VVGYRFICLRGLRGSCPRSPTGSSSTNSDSDIVLDGITASQHHAEFRRENRTLQIVDVGSLQCVELPGEALVARRHPCIPQQRHAPGVPPTTDKFRDTFSGQGSPLQKPITPLSRKPSFVRTTVAADRVPRAVFETSAGGVR
jgi:hypothetical protein